MLITSQLASLVTQVRLACLTTLTDLVIEADGLQLTELSASGDVTVRSGVGARIDQLSAANLLSTWNSLKQASFGRRKTVKRFSNISATKTSPISLSTTLPLEVLLSSGILVQR